MNIINSLFGTKDLSKPSIKFGIKHQWIEYRINGKYIEIGFDGENKVFTESIDKWISGEILSFDEKSTVLKNIISKISGWPYKKPIIVINIDFDGQFWKNEVLKYQKVSIETTSILEENEKLYNMYLENILHGGKIIKNSLIINTREGLDEYWKENNFHLKVK